MAYMLLAVLGSGASLLLSAQVARSLTRSRMIDSALLVACVLTATVLGEVKQHVPLGKWRRVVVVAHWASLGAAAVGLLLGHSP